MNKRGKDLVETLATGAIMDDTRGRVRQIVKEGGREQMCRDFDDALQGHAKPRDIETSRGPVRVAELDDGTKISARGFSSGGRPSIQVDDPDSGETIKVRYE